jgi:hypothetical protein
MRKIKFFVLLIALSCSANAVWSQDVIVLKKNAEEIKALVQEVGLTEVKYKKYENANGPSYTLLKADIFMIKYANGEKDVFKDEPAATDVSPKNRPQEGLASTKSQNAASELLTGKKQKTSLEIVNTKFENAYGEKLSAQEIRSVLADVPNALELYESGRRLHTIGSVCTWTGIGFMVMGGAMTLDIENANYKKAIPVYGIGLGCLTAAVIFGFKYNAKWKTAYELYQDDKSGRITSLNFGATPSGGLGLTLNF